MEIQIMQKIEANKQDVLRTILAALLGSPILSDGTRGTVTMPSGEVVHYRLLVR